MINSYGTGRGIAVGAHRTPRIGPSMDRALLWLHRHGGSCPSQREMACGIGPNGSHGYGVGIVYRLEKAGLVKKDYHADGNLKKRLTLTEKGKERVLKLLE